MMWETLEITRKGEKKAKKKKSWKKVISTNNMKNNRGELSARAPGFVIYGIKPGPRPGLDVYLTLLFLPSQTDAIHHVRHLTVQSVLEALDLGYSTR